MGKLLDDKAFLNGNIFQHESRMGSQYSVFLDKTPAFCTYYHIDGINSIVDSGFENIEKLLGPNSPIRFTETTDLPIYDIDMVQLNLNDDDEGITGSYEGDGILLPNTIKPLPDDFFIISYLSKYYLFRITTIEYDTIKSNNFYKINYYLRSLTAANYNSIKNQVKESYQCIFKNIGTTDKCIIRSDEYLKMAELEALFTAMRNKYKLLFFSNKYNAFVFEHPIANSLIYDRYISHFIQSNRLYSQKNSYDTVGLINEDYTDSFLYDYDVSIYRNLELCDKDIAVPVRFVPVPIIQQESIFSYYKNTAVRGIRFDTTNPFAIEYISDALMEHIKNNTKVDPIIPEDGVVDESIPTTAVENMVIDYFNSNIKNIYDLDLSRLAAYNMRRTMSDFVLIPFAMFILYKYSKAFMQLR